MSNFQHSQAVNSKSLSAIYDDMPTDWVTWSYEDADGICCDIRYEWGYWYIRSYISDADTLLGCRFTIVRTDARSLSTLRRRVNRLKDAYRFPHSVFVVQFLTAHFGAFHMYDTNASLSWINDVY